MESRKSEFVNSVEHFAFRHKQMDKVKNDLTGIQGKLIVQKDKINEYRDQRSDVYEDYLNAVYANYNKILSESALATLNKHIALLVKIISLEQGLIPLDINSNIEGYKEIIAAYRGNDSELNDKIKENISTMTLDSKIISKKNNIDFNNNLPNYFSGGVGSIDYMMTIYLNGMLKEYTNAYTEKLDNVNELINKIKHKADKLGNRVLEILDKEQDLFAIDQAVTELRELKTNNGVNQLKETKTQENMSLECTIKTLENQHDLIHNELSQMEDKLNKFPPKNKAPVTNLSDNCTQNNNVKSISQKAVDAKVNLLNNIESNLTMQTGYKDVINQLKKLQIQVGSDSPCKVAIAVKYCYGEVALRSVELCNQYENVINDLVYNGCALSNEIEKLDSQIKQLKYDMQINKQELDEFKANEKHALFNQCLSKLIKECAQVTGESRKKTLLQNYAQDIEEGKIAPSKNNIQHLIKLCFVHRHWYANANKLSRTGQKFLDLVNNDNVGSFRAELRKILSDDQKNDEQQIKSKELNNLIGVNVVSLNKDQYKQLKTIKLLETNGIINTQGQASNANCILMTNSFAHQSNKNEMFLN